MLSVTYLSMWMTSYLSVITLNWFIASLPYWVWSLNFRDLGHAHYFLGIEVAPTSVGLALSQHNYVLDILSRAGMSSCKLVDTPASISKLDLQPIELILDPTPFHQIIGVL